MCIHRTNYNIMVILQPLVAKLKTRISRATKHYLHNVGDLGRNKFMNIEIANRLVRLRKEKNLSQEALANELGISRQAVSKWERAEASPDTDNLILLAKLYGMSLDDLLKQIKKNLKVVIINKHQKKKQKKIRNKRKKKVFILV